MTRIAFVQDTFVEYFGIMYMASALKRHGHLVEMFIGTDINRQVRQLKDFQPNLVGFSCMTGTHRRALAIAAALKSAMKTVTIFGGPHPTFFPEMIEEKGVDVVCVGEGEEAILELAAAVEEKRNYRSIANLWVKEGAGIIRNEVRPLQKDLNTLAFPDRSVYYSKYSFMNTSRKTFIAGRGCPYQCTYCFNDSLRKLYQDKGQYVRLRSVRNLLEEIEETCKRFRARTVYLLDDTFILNKAWLYEFLDEYRRRINLSFMCLVRADLITGQVVEKLKAAGCCAVFFGIESGNEALRQVVLGKKVTNQQIAGAARLLKHYGIKFRTYNMMGIPGENLEMALETVKLNHSIKTDFPWCSILQPYPKTEIDEHARSLGMVKDGDIPQYFFKYSVLEMPQIDELSNLQKLFFWAVKFPWLLPLIKTMIKLPRNFFLLDWLFLISYAYSYCRSERLGFWEVLRLGWANTKLFFARV